MGVKASGLPLIDMLKGTCGGGGLDIPLTGNDSFDKNCEIVDDKFDEYLMQQDDEDQGEERVFHALASMVVVGQRMKPTREDLLEDKTRARNSSSKQENADSV
jgi:hypothetical protein